MSVGSEQLSVAVPFNISLDIIEALPEASRYIPIFWQDIIGPTISSVTVITCCWVAVFPNPSS